MGEAPNGGCAVCAGFGLNLSVIFDIFTKKLEVEQLATSFAEIQDLGEGCRIRASLS